VGLDLAFHISDFIQDEKEHITEPTGISLWSLAISRPFSRDILHRLLKYGDPRIKSEIKKREVQQRCGQCYMANPKQFLLSKSTAEKGQQ
jgi:hypothetical protein